MIDIIKFPAFVGMYVTEAIHWAFTCRMRHRGGRSIHCDSFGIPRPAKSCIAAGISGPVFGSPWCIPPWATPCDTRRNDEWHKGLFTTPRPRRWMAFRLQLGTRVIRNIRNWHIRQLRKQGKNEQIWRHFYGTCQTFCLRGEDHILPIRCEWYLGCWLESSTKDIYRSKVEQLPHTYSH